MKRLPTFISGMLTMALIGSLGVGALAATGRMTIEVDPINIQVNGETFRPKDEKGNDVPVFAYNGTTYAPLRALAEAYGLEVGYDAEAKMATVGDGTKATVAPSDVSTSTKSPTIADTAIFEAFNGGGNQVEDVDIDPFIVNVNGANLSGGITPISLTHFGRIYVCVEDVCEALEIDCSQINYISYSEEEHLTIAESNYLVIRELGDATMCKVTFDSETKTVTFTSITT